MHSPGAGQTGLDPKSAVTGAVLGVPPGGTQLLLPSQVPVSHKVPFGSGA